MTVLVKSAYAYKIYIYSVYSTLYILAVWSLSKGFQCVRVRVKGMSWCVSMSVCVCVCVCVCVSRSVKFLPAVEISLTCRYIGACNEVVSTWGREEGKKEEGGRLSLIA